MITTDTSATSNVYVSISNSGSCFDANTGVNEAIPSLEVTCIDSICSTIALATEFGYDTYTIPSLSVTCDGAVYTTSPITFSTDFYNYQVYLLALTVGFITPAAGSLYALCMYQIDH